eukprot:717110-Pleurochrysis_carterae.AAC.1
MLIQRYRVAGTVSPGKELAFDTFWERGHELPPFKVDNDSAVDLLLAVLSSPVGTVVKQSLLVVTEAVAVQIYELLTSQQLDRVNARASGYAVMPAVYTALASLHCNERVRQPSEQTLKRLAVAALRKGKVGRIGFGGKRAVGLVKDLRLCVNQRCFDPDLRDLSAAEAKIRLLFR